MIRKVLEFFGFMPPLKAPETLIRLQSQDVLDGLSLTIALSGRRDWKEGIF